MGLLIGMFMGETLKINPVIERGAGKLTSMPKLQQRNLMRKLDAVDGV